MRALEDVTGDRLPVHRMAEGLAHATVGERLLLDVEAHVPHREPRRLVHRDAGRLLEPRDEVGRDRQDEVDAAREQLGHAGVGFGEASIDQGLRLALRAPVVVVAAQHQATAALPGLDLVSAAADGLGVEVGRRLREGVRADDRAVRQREQRQQRARRVLQLELHGLGIEHLDRLHAREIAGDERPLAALRVRVGGVDDAVEGELDGGRVEHRPVVEADATAQLERPGQAVGRRGPRLREPGDDVGAVGGGGDERLEDLGGHAQGVDAERLTGIEARRLGLHADHEHVARSLCRTGGREHRDDQQRSGERDES
jgi:hypothetical protein